MLFSGDFGDSGCTLWISTSKGANDSSPMDQQISYDDLSFEFDEECTGIGDDDSMDESEHAGESQIVAEQGSNFESDENQYTLAEYIGNDCKGSKPAHAVVEYLRAFPNGYDLIETPTDGLLCGFAAIVRSMQAVYPRWACPTVAGLRRVFSSPAFVEHATAFGMTNENNFSVDQVAAVLYFWGMENRINIRTGYIIEGEDPQLVPHPNDLEYLVCWIHNDNNGNEATGALGHFSGMEPRRQFD